LWQVDSEPARWQIQEKISDLEQRLSRDVAASRDVDSLRAELQAATAKINHVMHVDDNAATQYVYQSVSHI